MKLSIASVVFGLASIATAANPVAGFDPKDAAPSGCPSPTPCYCPNFHIEGTSYSYYCNNAPATKGPIQHPASAAPVPSTTPTGPASSQATITASPKSSGDSSSPQSTGEVTVASSSPSASASGKPNAGGRSMTVSGGLWAVAAVAFGAVVYRL
ncbi:hypothetical protein MMC29_003345 [Sticta canariensis]|nr:hypothetical protein [Sticta canariensis]